MKKKIFPLVLSTLMLIPNTVLAQNQFTDITGHWATAEIEAIYQKGYLKGISSDKFSPNTLVTRAELAASLDRVFDFNYDDLRFTKTPTAKDFYNDIQEGQWYSDAALKCGLNGIIDTENRKFSPSQPVTRLEIAKAINNSFKAKKLGVITTLMLPNFADTINLSQEDQRFIGFIFNTGIMKGTTSQLFNPNDNLTRAELAVILNRTLSTLQNAFPIIEEPAPQKDTMINYITEFLTKGYSKYYTIDSIKCELIKKKEYDGKIEAIFLTTMNYHVQSKNPEDLPYIIEAKEKAQKETDPEKKRILQNEYETLVKEYGEPKEANYMFKLTANLINAKIDENSIKLLLEQDAENGVTFIPAEDILPKD